jgi:hypothetical protein
MIENYNIVENDLFLLNIYHYHDNNKDMNEIFVVSVDYLQMINEKEYYL